MLTFHALREEHLETVLQWRSSPEINAVSVTRVTYDMETQRRWFAAVTGDPTSRVWVVGYRERPIGVLQLERISWEHRRCSIGFYIGEPAHRQLFGLVLPYVYNYVFRRLKLHKIFGEVLGTNSAVLAIHLRHGYREVGRYVDHLVRDGGFVDVVLVELLEDDWRAQRRYQRYEAEFEE
jgi:UDP-4-amino-4,6-dideoxy-N-acetyl-beta-L-altrosamine N-acetyltransferase